MLTLFFVLFFRVLLKFIELEPDKMGVPGLTGRMKGREYRIKPESLSGWKIYIDGPSLSYFICKSELIPNDRGNYRQYYKAASETIERILSFTSDVHILFDGALPEEKRPMRLQRRQDSISRKKYEPVFAPQLLLQVLKDGFPQVRYGIASDEADTAIANRAEQEKVENQSIAIMSSDSDFYTYKFSSPDIYLMPLANCDFLSPTPVIYLTNLQKVRHLVKPQDLKTIPPLVPETVVDVDFIYTHELINTYVGSGFLGAYLQVVGEELKHAPAWEVGRELRSIAYSRLLRPFGEFKTLVEFSRSGMRYLSKEVKLNNDDKSHIIESLSTQKNLINTMVNEICLTSRGPGRGYERIVNAYFETVLTIDSPLDVVTVEVINSELVQVFAKIQAMIYSLMLLQSSGIKINGAKDNINITHIDWNTFAKSCNAIQ